jgi:RNA polymerase sigma-70 factor (ECF subfamily)
MPIALAVGDLPPEAARADAIAGPRAATDGLEAFLRRSEGRALLIAELTTRDREEALDLVQEAMLRFVRRYAGCPPGEWPALFHRVLTHALIDWTRRQRVRAAFRALFGARDEEEARDWPLTVPEPGPEAAASAAELSERLFRALAALPLRQRQVFLLRVWEGLPVEATARALGIGEGSVKTHLSRALARIKEALDGFC